MSTDLQPTKRNGESADFWKFWTGQAIVPNEMLGRVISVAGVLAWSAIPLGAILGGWAIERTGDVVMVFAVIGVVRVLIPIVFSFTPLGHAEDYLPKKEEAAEVAA